MGMLLDLIQELETDMAGFSSDACGGSAELLAPQAHRRTMTMPTSMSQSCETFLATREGVCLNVARRHQSRSVDHVDRNSLVWRDTGIADFFRDLTDIFERTLRQKKGLDPDCALPEAALRRRKGRRRGGWEAGQRNTLHEIQFLLPPRAGPLLPCASSPDLVSAFALSELNPFGLEPELDDPAPPFGLGLGERGDGEGAFEGAFDGAFEGACAPEGHRWSLQELDGPSSAEVLPPGLVWQTMDSSTCLELALEGERLCKAGDCRAGVAFFEAAIQTGTDDLRTLSAIYSQLGNAYFYLGEYDKAMEFHKLDLTVARTMGDRLGVAKASGNLGNTLKVMGKFKEAICCCERHLAISQELEDKVGEGRALYNLGNVYHAQGKHLGRIGPQEPGGFSDEVKHCLQKAVEYYAANLRLMEELSDRSAQGRACGNLGNTHYLLGNFTQAIGYHNERLTIAKEFGDKAAERRAHSNLGNAHIFLGEFETAAEHYKKTLQLAQELSDRAVEAQACYSLGNTYTLLRDYPMAIHYHLRHLAIAQELNDKVGEGRACWSLGNAYSATNAHEKALQYANRHLDISKEIGDKTGQAAAQMNLTDIRKVLGLPPTTNDTSESADDAKSRTRRKSMENMDLLKTSVNEESSMDEDSFFELLSRFQSKRMDDQRCTLSIDSNKENQPEQVHQPVAPRREAGSVSSTGSTNGTTTPSDSGANNCGVLEELMESIAGMQSRRMDEQRASLPQLPGLNNQHAILQRLSVAASDSTPLPDDNFFDMLMRCQGSRIEDQRSSLPNEGHLTHSAPTVPDDDFFSLIMRFQSGRLEDQRSTMPLEATRNSAHPTADEEEAPANGQSAGAKDGLVSRLVKGRK
ncbi:G-protein-signaling modulator 2-like isoform X3 [Penaeus japonicus]|uniref:G-protein-signaling modulator 2-like isoform X3 n=1 Tax=Penaeus japonicus TaxID=27405 RepID=UPI001C70E365|nr:G-protein-signaling modulator 2-like isoform X3 [Penaeus japonicus]